MNIFLCYSITLDKMIFMTTGYPVVRWTTMYSTILCYWIFRLLPLLCFLCYYKYGCPPLSVRIHSKTLDDCPKPWGAPNSTYSMSFNNVVKVAQRIGCQPHATLCECGLPPLQNEHCPQKISPRSSASGRLREDTEAHNWIHLPWENKLSKPNLSR